MLNLKNLQETQCRQELAISSFSLELKLRGKKTRATDQREPNKAFTHPSKSSFAFCQRVGRRSTRWWAPWLTEGGSICGNGTDINDSRAEEWQFHTGPVALIQDYCHVRANVESTTSSLWINFIDTFMNNREKRRYQCTFIVFFPAHILAHLFIKINLYHHIIGETPQNNRKDKTRLFISR